MYIFCWTMWIGGASLIVASFAHLVPPAIGWVGLGAALLGALVSLRLQQSGREMPTRSVDEGSKGSRPVDEAGSVSDSDWR
jgi:hypothetical protein